MSEAHVSASAGGVEAPAQTLFVRQATGLVRQARVYDAIFYNVIWSSVALAFAFYYLFEPFFYRGSDLVVTTLIAAAFGLPGAFLYGMLTHVMPRTGGDYVFVSRTLHPAIGFMNNFSAMLWLTVVAGVYAIFTAAYGAGAWFRMLAGFYGAGTLGTAQWFSSQWGIFTTGTVAIVLSAAVFVLSGPRLFFRIQRGVFVLYLLGAFLIPVFVGLIVSHGEFLKSFDDYAANLGVTGAAAKVVSGAHKAGWTAVGFSGAKTVLAVSVAWYVFGFLYPSNYIAGEIRSGKRTHLISIPGALVVATALTLILVPTFQSVAGGNFVSMLGSADPASYGFSGGTPAYPEIVAIASGSGVLGTIVLLGFAAGLVIWFPLTLMLVSRCMLAWSFDGVMPKQLAHVDERRHSPVIAVLVGTIFFIGSTAIYAFTTWFTTLVVLFPLTLTLMVVAITGIVLPFRRRDLFEASPVNQRWKGIPVLSIVGALAFLGFSAVVGILLSDVGSGTSVEKSLNIVLIAVGLFLVPGPVIYFVARWWRARQGVDLDLVYAEIPPE